MFAFASLRSFLHPSVLLHRCAAAAAVYFRFHLVFRQFCEGNKKMKRRRKKRDEEEKRRYKTAGFIRGDGDFSGLAGFGV